MDLLEEEISNVIVTAGLICIWEVDCFRELADAGAIPERVSPGQLGLLPPPSLLSCLILGPYTLCLGHMSIPFHQKHPAASASER